MRRPLAGFAAALFLAENCTTAPAATTLNAAPRPSTP